MKLSTCTMLGAALLLASLSSAAALARGFGGLHGGGGMGGFGGGAHAGVGGAGLGGGGQAGFAGGIGGARPDFGNVNRANLGSGALAPMGANGGAGNFARSNLAGAASPGQLSSFLGLPSDEGFHGLGNEFNVSHGAVQGPRGGTAAGVSVEGPRGNEAARGAAVGPDGRVAAGGGVRGADGYGAARGFVAGPNGAVAGFTHVTPTDRYFTGRMVQGNFHDWGVYGAGWYTAHPGAWYAAGWAAGAAWTTATWPVVGAWFDYPETATPVSYDYGNTITSSDGNVYIDGQSAGTTEQYYDQSAALANSGAQTAAAPDEQWLPLGVFALTQRDHDRSDLTIQLAVDKQGVIRGNYADARTDKTMTVQGSVDKSTQRVDFTVGDKQDVIFETGLYSLTKDESPVLIQHKDHSEQWLLVRLKQPANGDSANSTSANTVPAAAQP